MRSKPALNLPRNQAPGCNPDVRLFVLTPCLFSTLCALLVFKYCIVLGSSLVPLSLTDSYRWPRSNDPHQVYYFHGHGGGLKGWVIGRAVDKVSVVNCLTLLV